MRLDQLVVCIRDCDQLTQEELADHEYIQDRIAIHLENTGYEPDDFNIPQLATEIQQELIVK